MPNDIPTREPMELRAGDSWRWDRAVASYPPSDGWALSYILRRGEDAAKTVSATASSDGDFFEVRVAANATQTYPPGLYQIVGRVSKDTDRFTIFEGYVVVLGDLATMDPSHLEQLLSKLKAQEIELAESAAVQSWTQGGRSETLAQLDSLRAMIGRVSELVRRERGGPAFVPIRGRFVRA